MRKYWLLFFLLLSSLFSISCMGEPDKKETREEDINVSPNVFVTEIDRVMNKYEIKDGILYGSGVNNLGQLGTGEVDDLSKEYEPLIIAEHVKHIDFNGETLIYITEDNELFGVGLNHRGQLGQDIRFNDNSRYAYNSIPEPVKILENVSFAALGQAHIIVLKEDGSVWAIGDNMNGQLGNKKEWVNNFSSPDSYSNTPVHVMDNVVSIAVSSYNSAAITRDGVLYLWGDNSCGQIGNGKSGNGYPTISDCVSTLPEMIKTGITDFHFYVNGQGKLHCYAYSEWNKKEYRW
nr:hypothetical protein [uncultured Eisenbergiella sp.]